MPQIDQAKVKRDIGYRSDCWDGANKVWVGSVTQECTQGQPYPLCSGFELTRRRYEEYLNLCVKKTTIGQKAVRHDNELEILDALILLQDIAHQALTVRPTTWYHLTA